jgi:N-acyl-D-aspartate/D-glutamate deacylase
VDPVELMIDLALETNFEQFFVQVIANRDPEQLLSIMRHPQSLVTFSDSGAHVSQIMDSSLQTHLLAHWVREKQSFLLEDAVRNITSKPAEAWHFDDRGLVREGFVADLNVIDAERVAPAMPEVVSDLPGGAKRLMQRSVGIRSTIVGGQEVLANGEPTGNLPGVLIRSR